MNCWMKRVLPTSVTEMEIESRLGVPTTRSIVAVPIRFNRIEVNRTNARTTEGMTPGPPADQEVIGRATRATTTATANGETSQPGVTSTAVIRVLLANRRLLLPYLLHPPVPHVERLTRVRATELLVDAMVVAPPHTESEIVRTGIPRLLETPTHPLLLDVLTLLRQNVIQVPYPDLLYVYDHAVRYVFVSFYFPFRLLSISRTKFSF